MLEAFEIVCRAIADPNRVRILKLLQAGELCVCQITAVLDLAPATISKHLSLLKSSGLVQQRRDGKWIHYRLAQHELNRYVRPFLAFLKKALDDDLTVANDARLLERVLSTPIESISDRGRAALTIDDDCCGAARQKRPGVRRASSARSIPATGSRRHQSRRAP